MTRPALPPLEADLMKWVLCDALERNRWSAASTHPELPLARDLAARGFMTMAAEARGFVIAVTNAGARALIAAGVIRARDLAEGADRMLSQLRFSRSTYERGLSDPSLGDLSWDAFADTPHNRAAANALLKRGHVEQRPAATDQERRWLASHLFLRATDEGMRA